MSDVIKLPVSRGFGETDRTDKWWTQPLWMGFALTLAMIYTFVRLIFFDGAIHYDNHRVTSPIFSPDIIHLWGLSVPGWANSAMLILWIPFGFRGTCYYMRKVYYRTFFASPTACVVSKPHLVKSMGYRGERGLFVLNNIHRYMLYLAMIILLMKYYDIFHTVSFDQNDGTTSYGISLGTFVLAAESFLLTMYVGSCHAFRHIIGGGSNKWRKGFSKLQGKFFWRISSINVHHGFWFWTSLAMVFIGDLFVWGVAEGILSDPSIVF
ncbi:MAG: hypothetical protein VXW30_07065 [Candidatus Thermoplasmatota archaeon]|nr:hypothetical protein [Candidatus Thermoplasmatota archaeon]MEC7143324.1 hypothetical protein [Candidatus Thermoplasmatota archaeon]MEC7390457.1 hypothetical protein [Candidatus Thermoplasmatota archaeon]MEC7544482.1 hypothetical protein [Candidatus Thermoplasmatota archaeon]MEC8384348.1 hypothetical protein [Candidatus Thermoplasmatota archaeon]|tara:strand:- start:25 stop:822 length:798 start_codon:yes stop_codon:yes gene_type:complete